MVTLLFDGTSTYLGELATQDGVLRHFVLTKAGEEVLDGHVLHWQTRGVPVHKGIAKHDADGSREFVMYREYVPPRDPQFLRSVHRWLANRSLQAYDIPDTCLPMWERLLRLPLENSERFHFLLAILRTPVKQLKAWQELLDSADRAAHEERTKTQQALLKLKTAVSKHLLHAFEQSKAV